MKRNFIFLFLTLLLIGFQPIASNAQSGSSSDESIKKQINWQNADLKKDKKNGVSTDKAYEEILKGKTSTPIIVAVIDGGVDIFHEDLKEVIWTNPKEIPDNGIDDDNNGYIDDVHGWSFLGIGKKGSVDKENLDEQGRAGKDQHPQLYKLGHHRNAALQHPGHASRQQHAEQQAERGELQGDGQPPQQGHQVILHDQPP